MMYAKLIGGAAIALIIYLGYQYVTNLQEDNATLTGNVAKLEVSNAILSEEQKKFKEDLKRNKILVMDLNKKVVEIREEKNEVIRLFGNHNFEKIYKAKPNLVIKKMNSATKKIFKEIEKHSTN